MSYLDLPSGCYNVQLSISGGESQGKAFRHARLGEKYGKTALVSDRGSGVVLIDTLPFSPFGKKD